MTVTPRPEIDAVEITYDTGVVELFVACRGTPTGELVRYDGRYYTRRDVDVNASTSSAIAATAASSGSQRPKPRASSRGRNR